MSNPIKPYALSFDVDKSKGLDIINKNDNYLITLNFEKEKNPNTVTWNVLKNTEISELNTNAKTIIEAINELKASLEKVSAYSLLKEVIVNDTKYIFQEYDPSNWYLFVFELEVENHKINGVLERPSGVDLRYISSTDTLDYSQTSSVNLLFNPETRTIEVKRWEQKNRTITKLTIYSKK